MASIVRVQLRREEAAAAPKLGASHRRTLLTPVTEVATPTTPAMREKITKRPVAMFPIGKYIGNMRAGIDNIDAAKIQIQFYKNNYLVNLTQRKQLKMTCFMGSLNCMIYCPTSYYCYNDIQTKIEKQQH